MSKTTKIITTAIRIILTVFIAVLIVREAGFFTALAIGLLSLGVELNGFRIKSLEGSVAEILEVTDQGFKDIADAVRKSIGKKEKP